MKHNGKEYKIKGYMNESEVNKRIHLDKTKYIEDKILTLNHKHFYRFLQELHLTLSGVTVTKFFS